MNTEPWIALGLAALLLLAIWCGHRLAVEYLTRREPTLATVAAVWTFYALHFGLVLLAAIESTWPLPLLPGITTVGGFLALISGGIVYLLGLGAFRSLQRMSGQDTRRLITHGIYRWSCNPQTVGWALVLLGIALLRASGLVLLLTLLFWISFRLYLPLEERLLERLFGQEYRHYRSRTHRYFGPPRSG